MLLKHFHNNDLCYDVFVCMGKRPSKMYRQQTKKLTETPKIYQYQRCKRGFRKVAAHTDLHLHSKCDLGAPEFQCFYYYSCILLSFCYARQLSHPLHLQVVLLLVSGSQSGSANLSVCLISQLRSRNIQGLSGMPIHLQVKNLFG